jgi:hypothetical protein
MNNISRSMTLRLCVKVAKIRKGVLQIVLIRSVFEKRIQLSLVLVQEVK